MRIVCPSCSATFEVPKTRLRPGQVVRCARCSKDWTPIAEPEPVSAEQPIETAEPDAPPVLPRPPERGAELDNLFSPAPTGQAMPRTTRLPSMLDHFHFATAGGPALVVAWAASILVLAGLVWAAVAWRGDVMHAWPPSERLYTTLGLPAEP